MGIGAEVSPLVRTETDGAVTVLSLDRADRHNALVPELLADLRAGLDGVDDATRAVLLRAEGRSFSTGGDLAAFARHTDRPDAIAAYAHGLLGELNAAVLALLDLPVPLVVALGGPVTGGSIGLVAPADVVVAADHAWIQPYYAQVGFSPDGGWTALLPHLIGRGRVADTLVRDRRISAREAADWGLVSEVVADDAVDVAARVAADRIAGLRPGALSSTRQLLAHDRAAVAGALEAERASFCAQIRTPEAREGIHAFLAELATTPTTGGR